MIQVRQATWEDKAALFRFIRRAYQGRWEYKIPERWQWAYVDNPFLEGPGLPIWIAVDPAGQVVGQTCALVEPLKVGSAVHRVGWSVDTFLLPEYRGQGIGYRLQQANDEANRIFMSLSMSAANRRIKARLGSVPIAPVPSFLKTVRHEPARAMATLLAGALPGRESQQQRLASLLRVSRLDRALGAALTLRGNLRDARLQAQADPSVSIEAVDTFGPEVDTLWDEMATHFYAAVPRQQAFLNWKFVRQPHMHYRRFVARRGDRMVGYLVLRRARPPEPNLGVLADLLAAPHDEGAVLSLLLQAVAQLKQQGVDAIVAATTVPAYQTQMRRLGFRQTKEDVPMLHCRLDANTCERLTRPGAWLLGKGDHDWDQYPLAR